MPYPLGWWPQCNVVLIPCRHTRPLPDCLARVLVSSTLLLVNLWKHFSRGLPRLPLPSILPVKHKLSKLVALESGFMCPGHKTKPSLQIKAIGSLVLIICRCNIELLYKNKIVIILYPVCNYKPLEENLISSFLIWYGNGIGCQTGASKTIVGSTRAENAL